MEFCIQPIGVIHTPFKEKSETPVQFSRSIAAGEIEVFPEFEEGLTSLKELSHIMLFYVFHEALDSKPLLGKPFLDERKHGVFTARYCVRPNPLGFSVVHLLKRTGRHL